MFGMGMPEILMILAVALIVIGPKKLPEIARTLGRAMNEFRQATQDFKQGIELDYNLEDVRKPFEDVRDELQKPVAVEPEVVDIALKKGHTTASDISETPNLLSAKTSDDQAESPSKKRAPKQEPKQEIDKNAD